jgi:hypothetical protein
MARCQCRKHCNILRLLSRFLPSLRTAKLIRYPRHSETCLVWGQGCNPLWPPIHKARECACTHETDLNPSSATVELQIPTGQKGPRALGWPPVINIRWKTFVTERRGPDMANMILDECGNGGWEMLPRDVLGPRYYSIQHFPLYPPRAENSFP